MTATATAWAKFDGQHLSPGDEIKMSSLSRKLSGKVGIVERKLPKNIAVIIDGLPWRVSPSLIDMYRRGSITNLPEAKKAIVECDPDGLSSCNPGDAVLMYRGTFDVVEIVSLLPLRCKALDGRSRGKVYTYRVDMFVQKLDSDRFS